MEKDHLDRKVLELLDEIESLNFSIKTLQGQLSESYAAAASAEERLAKVKSEESLKSKMQNTSEKSFLNSS